MNNDKKHFIKFYIMTITVFLILIELFTPSHPPVDQRMGVYDTVFSISRQRRKNIMMPPDGAKLKNINRK